MSKYVTVVDGLGEKTTIPKAALEQYKKQMEEFLEGHKKLGGSKQGEKAYQIAKIIEE